MKGELEKGSVVSYPLPQLEEIGCGPADNFHNVSVWNGLAYLVYARDGKLLRTASTLRRDTDAFAGAAHAAFEHGLLYEPGERSDAWQKLKLENQQESVIGGYRPGSNGVDALPVGYYRVGRHRINETQAHQSALRPSPAAGVHVGLRKRDAGGTIAEPCANRHASPR